MLCCKRGRVFYCIGAELGKRDRIRTRISKTEVEKNMFEDGKLFYMEEMNEKEMFEKMIEEIEG